MLLRLWSGAYPKVLHSAIFWPCLLDSRSFMQPRCPEQCPMLQLKYPEAQALNFQKPSNVAAERRGSARLQESRGSPMRLTYKTWKGRGRHEQAGLEIGFHDQDREWGDIGKLGDRQVEEKVQLE
eukprot:scaffold196820_cov19-Tisochrysis_lutea.AAC.6